MSLKRKTKITKSQKNNKYVKKQEQQEDQSLQTWNCKVCDKCFVRYSWLKRHELSHASDKKFHCVYCNSKHKRKDNLLQHLRIKHPGELLSEIENQMILEKCSSVEILNFKAASKNLLAIASSNTKIDTNPSLVNNKENVIRILVANGLLKKDFLRKVSNALISHKEHPINH
ncbi:uncharacterized protein SCODWIG_02850 [Saccharomycodes ludwigii]|uniref:C2H2-type domain-containing protein n=2 Tax=Saccharomycodes ludwigii TaxID=36035 RepID=A0A376B945_9ASCO|nr:uncharacterized protein SCODWIG_02850 [Saccharomycodes ludwigii]